MNLKKILASVAAGALAVSAMGVAAFAEEEEAVKIFEGSVTLKGGSWWDAASYGTDGTGADHPLSDLIGYSNPKDVTSITFTCKDLKFTVGYNSTEVTGVDEETGADTYWAQSEYAAGDEITLTDIRLTSDAELEQDPYVMLAISTGDAGEFTISWVAVVEPETPDPETDPTVTSETDPDPDPADTSDEQGEEPADTSDEQGEEPTDTSDEQGEEPTDTSDEQGEEPTDTSEEDPATSDDDTTTPADSNPDVSNSGDDSNQNTGLAIAIVPAVVAAAGAVIAKKRK